VNVYAFSLVPTREFIDPFSPAPSTAPPPTTSTICRTDNWPRPPVLGACQIAHRMPFNFINDESKFVSMTWQAKFGWPDVMVELPLVRDSEVVDTPG